MSSEKRSTPQSNLHTVERELHCLKCGATTKHRLTPVFGGAEFRCTTCAHATQKFTHSQMAEIVMRRMFKLPKKPVAVPIPDGYKVFLKHHGPSADEMEASRESVENHVALTGQLPKVGKPLYASVAGVKELALPYGEVVRIEDPS